MTEISAVTMVVVNYGSTEMIRALLRSVPSSTPVVVVDNFSSSGELSRVRDLVSGRENSRLVERDNRGYAAGLNAGIEFVDVGSMVIVANPDTSFLPGSFDNLVDVLRSGRLDLASPVILQTGTDEGRVWFNGGKVSKVSWLVTHTGYGELFVRSSDVVATSFLSGCVMAFTPKAVGTVFPIEDSLFMYYEDVLISMHAASEGLKMGVCQNAVVRHDEGATSRGSAEGRSRLFFYYQSRNRLLAAKRAGAVYFVSALLSSPWVYARLSAQIVRRESDRGAKIRCVGLGMLDGAVGSSGKSSRSVS